jgi:hypothetical protein
MTRKGASHGAPRMRLRDMRRLVETDLRDLQKLLNRNPKTARAELAKIFQKSRSHRGKRSMSEFETDISASPGLGLLR